MQALGDRLKQNYENRCRHSLLRRMPVIIRVDGRAFHSYTRGMDRPFDETLMCAMLRATMDTARAMQGFKVAYIQSDEASFLLTDYDALETEAWFGYVQSKLESISASLFTRNFNNAIRFIAPDNHRYSPSATFDARAFNIPKEEVANYFLWRQKDWERNSLSMYCRAHFSAKQLKGKNRAKQHEMLHSVGKNWAMDLNDQQRNGTFLTKETAILDDIQPSYPEIEKLVAPCVHPEQETPCPTESTE